MDEFANMEGRYREQPVTWFERDGKQVIPMWISIDFISQQGIDGRDRANWLQSYCDDPLPPTTMIPVVAMRGQRGDDFAVYMGFPETKLQTAGALSRSMGQHTIPGTMRHGYKVSEALGRALFPRLRGFNYRE